MKIVIKRDYQSQISKSNISSGIKFFWSKSGEFFEFLDKVRLVIIATFVRELSESFVFIIFEVMTDIQKTTDSGVNFRRCSQSSYELSFKLLF